MCQISRSITSTATTTTTTSISSIITITPITTKAPIICNKGEYNNGNETPNWLPEYAGQYSEENCTNGKENGLIKAYWLH